MNDGEGYKHDIQWVADLRAAVEDAQAILRRIDTMRYEEIAAVDEIYTHGHSEMGVSNSMTCFEDLQHDLKWLSEGLDRALSK
ncbi:hypothetical protein [Shinella sp. BYT-45]|uniref:hypothetical protein n=1 Tax=Shinella sp. BYT-45 TaxID=3377377 RepID=UPI00397FE085